MWQNTLEKVERSKHQIFCFHGGRNDIQFQSLPQFLENNQRNHLMTDSWGPRIIRKERWETLLAKLLGNLGFEITPLPPSIKLRSLISLLSVRGLSWGLKLNSLPPHRRLNRAFKVSVEIFSWVPLPINSRSASAADKDLFLAIYIIKNILWCIFSPAIPFLYPRLRLRPDIITILGPQKSHKIGTTPPLIPHWKTAIPWLVILDRSQADSTYGTSLWHISGARPRPIFNFFCHNLCA